MKAHQLQENKDDKKTLSTGLIQDHCNQPSDYQARLSTFQVDEFSMKPNIKELLQNSIENPLPYSETTENDDASHVRSIQNNTSSELLSKEEPPQNVNERIIQSEKVESRSLQVNDITNQGGTQQRKTIADTESAPTYGVTNNSGVSKH